MSALDAYWLVPGRILAGEYAGDPVDERVCVANLRCLATSGIRAVVDLTEEDEGLLPYAQLLDGVRYSRFRIRDVSVPRSAGEMVAILDTIDRHLAADEPVYVHCWGGVGRTGTVAGCFLVRHRLDGGDAIARLAELRAGCRKAHRLSPETEEQRSFVRRWRPGL